MSEDLMNKTEVDIIFLDISLMISNTKTEVMRQMNNSVITLYWGIGRKLTDGVLKGKKASYGQNIIEDLSRRLSDEYGNDAEYLYQNYSRYQDLVREEIYRIAVANVSDIINDNTALDDNLLSDILIKSKLSKNIKIQLWEKAIPLLNEETCKKHFDELGVSELKGIFTKRNTTTRNYAKNDYVTSILTALKRNTWIYDYYESDEEERYIVIKNAPKRGK